MRHVIYLGTDAERHGELRSTLQRCPELAPLGRACVGDVAAVAPRPAVALLDGVGMHPDDMAADMARIAVAWNRCAVVVITDDTQAVTVRTLLDAGATSILRSCARPDDLLATVRAAMDGRGLVDVDVVRPVMDVYAQMHLESRRRNRAVIESLAAAVEAKDMVTSRHLKAVSRLAMQLAAHVDPDIARTEAFLFGCLLHDVGKIGIPEHVLSKPGALTDEEWQIMRRHPEIGARVVEPLALPPMVTEVVLHHHERWDGRGYPHRLAGDELPVSARIFSVCDALEAMTAARPYRAPIPTNVAFERVRLEAGQQFDPDVIEALEDGVADGSIVLEGDDIGVPRPPRRRISSGV